MFSTMSFFLNSLIPRPSTHMAEPWFMVVLCVALVYFAWHKINYPFYLKMLAQSAFNYSMIRQEIREESIFSKRKIILYTPLALVMFSCFIYLCCTYYGYEIADQSGLSLFWKILLLATLVVIMKFSSFGLITETFGNEFGISELIFNWLLLMGGIASVLFPLNLFIGYANLPVAEVFIKIGTVLICLAYLWVIIRGVFFALQKKVRLFYIILYLCTLEILPLLMMYKAVLHTC